MVTGGGAGIGRGIAAGLTAFGAKVAVWERNPETCAAAAAEFGALGITTDVRDSAQVDSALAQTVAELVPVIFGRTIDDPHQLTFAFSEALAHVNILVRSGRLRIAKAARGLALEAA